MQPTEEGMHSMGVFVEMVFSSFSEPWLIALGPLDSSILRLALGLAISHIDQNRATSSNEIVPTSKFHNYELTI